MKWISRYPMVALFLPLAPALLFLLVVSNNLIPFQTSSPRSYTQAEGSLIYLFSFPRDTTKGLGLEEKFAFFLVNTYFYTYIIPIRLIVCLPLLFLAVL